MVTHGNCTYCGEHSIIHRKVESLCCTPDINIILLISKIERYDINITLYGNYTSITTL